MYYAKHPLKRLMAGILTMLAIVACSSCKHDDDDVTKIDYEKVADHTVLMYMVGDNNLSSLLENNVRQAHRAILDSVEVGALNLVVMKDNKQSGDDLPKLYWVHRNAAQRLDTVILQTWSEDIDMADPDILASVIKTTFTRFNTPIKGLVLASHAAGWVPVTTNHQYDSPRRKAFGYDQINQNNLVGSIELWDLAAALRQGPKFDYIIADCCHMGNAEAAYELRDVTRYLVASSLEVQGAGMPYRKVFTRLSRVKSLSDLPDALDYSMRCYFDENAPYGASKKGASVALYDLTFMPQLASSYQQLIRSNASRLEPLAEADPRTITDWLDYFQPLGRESTGSGGSVHYKYYYYDILDVINWLSEVDAANAHAAIQALQHIVLKEYHSSQFYSEIIIDHHCGMAVTLPETLHLANEPGYRQFFSAYASNAEGLLAAYHLTAWGAMMGY